MKARKEVTLAVIIGLLVGLLVVGGILRARSALNQLTPPELSSFTNLGRPSPSPTASPTSLFLTLDTLDNQVSTQNTILATGATLPTAYIVIIGELEEHIITPSETGHFSQEVKLVSGANTITITSYLADGTKAEKTLTTVYTTAEI